MPNHALVLAQKMQHSNQNIQYNSRWHRYRNSYKE